MLLLSLLPLGNRRDSSSGTAQSSEFAGGAKGGDSCTSAQEYGAEPAGFVLRLRTLSQGR